MFRLLDIILPRRCPLCDVGQDSLPANASICLSCTASLSRLEGGIEMIDGSLHIFAGRYKDLFKTAIKRVKFQRCFSLIPLLAELLVPMLPSELHDWDCIVPLPIRFSSFYKRGFHQTAMISRIVSAHTGVPVAHLLRQSSWRKRQMHLPRRERLTNMQGAFTSSTLAQGLSVLLVDDVVTTGSTMHEAKIALLEAGAASVDFAYLAKAPCWHPKKNNV